MANEVKEKVAEAKQDVKVDLNRPLEGIMFTNVLICVQHGKKFINKDENGDYYYNLTFSDGQEILSCTSGTKVGDELQMLHSYRLGLVYQDKKLRIVDFVEVPIN